MATQQMTVEVFYSYALEYEQWLCELKGHLCLLQQQGLTSLRHNQHITSRTDWPTTIEVYLKTASVILLLVSIDFFNADYYYGMEAQQASEREFARQARQIPDEYVAPRLNCAQTVKAVACSWPRHSSGNFCRPVAKREKTLTNYHTALERYVWKRKAK